MDPQPPVIPPPSPAPASPTQQPSSYTGLIVSSILLFPFGLIYAWRKGALDYVLPTVTIVFAAINILGSAVLPLEVSQFTVLTNTLGRASDGIWNTTLYYTVATIIVALIGLILGIYYRHKVGKEKAVLSIIDKSMLVITLVLPIIIQILLMNEIFAMVYSSITQGLL